ncbi:MAG: phage head closure protein [Pseudomonadota bacterium]
MGGQGPRLTRKLVLEEKSHSADGGGGETHVWATLGTLWAALDPASGREALWGQRPGQRVTHRITVRAAPQGSPRRPHAAQRFRLGARIFDILAVAEADEADAYLTCFVTEGPFA